MNWLAATIVTDDGEVPVRTLSVGELVSAALTAGSDGWWTYVSFLQLRGDRETFDAAKSLCASADPTRRALGADILAQLGSLAVTADDRTETVPLEHRRFRGPAIALLLDLIASETAETAEEVLSPAICALGHLGDPRAVEPIARHRHHPDVMVRWAAAVSLTAFADTDDAALSYLIGMTVDDAARVRDWACFGLRQTGRDTRAVRGALLARLDDTDAVTRAEALRALAELGDTLAIGPLLRVLDEPLDPDSDPTGEISSLLDEALRALAARTGDPRLKR
jgi:hypothetical protein